MNETPVNRTESIPVDTTPEMIVVAPKKKNYLPWLLGIMALVVVLTALFLIGKSKSTPTGSLIQPSIPQDQTTIAVTDIDISNWKTYVNSSLGVTLQYPSNWALNMDDQNAILTIKADPSVRSIGIEVSSLNKQNYISLDHWLAQEDKECEEGKQLAEKTGGDSECFVYSRHGERKINKFVSSKVLWSCCGSGPTVRYFIDGGLDKIYVVDLFPEDWNKTAEEYDEGSSKLAKTYQQILSSFKVSTKPTMEPSTFVPITCKDKFKPVITSLSSNSGLVGAKLEIKGCNFSSYEGDVVGGWIINSQGIGFLRGETGSTNNLLKVTLKSPLCQNNTSGLPCDASFTLTPGTYKIYVIFLGNKSNEVDFIVK